MSSTILSNYNLQITDIIPNIKTGMNSVGFLFGAGTSFEAGFPLCLELTQSVINGLEKTEKDLISRIIENCNNVNSTDYCLEKNIPDIEIILNLVYRAINGAFETDINSLKNLEIAIKNKIVNEISFIKNPNIENHINLFNKLKTLIGHNHMPFWVFTTNYDLVFEHACMNARLPLRNGFIGSVARYFDMNRYSLSHGKISRKGFEPFKEPYLKLIKLHGSISWYKDEKGVYEFSSDYPLVNNCSRVMIFPKCDKVVETMDSPYQSLFDYSHKVIGEKCKFLVCCGYSFRDQHINQRLLLPKLSEGKVRIFAFFKDEPDCIQDFKKFSCFNYLTQDKLFINQKEYEYKNELWKFSNFVNFICL